MVGLQSLCEYREETAGPSTPLRSGRDEKFVAENDTDES